LAAVNDNTGATVWATSSSKASLVGATWGADSEAPVVRGHIDRPYEAFQPVDTSALIDERVREAVLEISNELDGPVVGFGRRFKALLAAKSEELARVFSTPCSEIVYSDRYLFSPLTVRLVFELIGSFAERDTRVRIQTHGFRRDSRGDNPSRIEHDWRDLSVRDVVLKTLIAGICPSFELATSGQSPHRRRLDFQTQAGAGIFDQGVGSWRTEDRIRFDFGATPAEQARRLHRSFSISNGTSGTFAAVRLT
jgi:DEAD/DEAH box helicase domain-containing protein